MDSNGFLKREELSPNPQLATKSIAEVLLKSTYPLLLRIRKKLLSYDGPLSVEDFNKIHSVFVLCSSQIKKNFQTLLSIFKMEYKQHLTLQDSRQSVLERLSWCVNRVHTIEKLLDNSDGNVPDEDECSLLVTPIYFVNWVDHTFEELSKLADVIYNTDCKENEESYKQWQNDVLDCVSDLHITLDELLLSAMTLCKYCLPADQLIIKARCQVVLRESKALISELIKGETGNTLKATLESLKLPINPSNVNVLIDVLKDVLYALETNTNTALLSLLVHSFSYDASPVDVLKEHFQDSERTCPCLMESDTDDAEDCPFVKEFDMYNERLLQLGSFAVSCSSDLSRITPLRSGLASLEALDPQLVPALMLCPRGPHAALLAHCWRSEAGHVRDGVFLIVDPAAFAEKSKQMMHEILLPIMKEPGYNNARVCSVIDIGCVVRDFFNVYYKQEPDALSQYEKLMPLLSDLDKVQLECKIVSNLMSTGDDYLYDVKKPISKDVSLEQLKKRLRLLYTIVSRINSLLHPKEIEDQLFECEIDEEVPKNKTHTIYQDNAYKYLNSPRKLAELNISRSIFARTTDIRSSTRNFPLSKLTKHLKAKRCDELSFSVQLDEMFNLSEVKKPTDNNQISQKHAYKHLDVREPSILYNFSSKKRASLRKLVMSKHFKMSNFKSSEDTFKHTPVTDCGNGSLIDQETSLQITEILHQMTDMSQALSTTSALPNDTIQISRTDPSIHTSKIPVKNANSTISKQIWNIPESASTLEIPLDESNSRLTEPSNFSTLERVKDICLVESKLNRLKDMGETSV